MQFRDSRTKWQFLPGRRLLFEELERRDLLAVMRIVNWNTLNGPNNSTDDANFSTVLAAIGNETVQSNTQRVDILALQETDPPGNGDSITRVKNVLNSLYSTTSYQLTVSSVDGGGDSTGFVYDTSTVSLLESVPIGSGTLTHTVMRGKFQPVGSPASSIFYVYSVHLKSGTSGADAALRGSEAAFLRANADALGDGTQVLMVGDFNMNGSTENAWTNIVSAGAGQLQDVANAPGTWSDNPAFKSLHSQDPRYDAISHFGMDDRFDIQFASGEFYDGAGVDYVSNSFHIFGNNGTHTFDRSITTSTWADPNMSAVLTALVAASDHLPAVADYKILAFTPSVRISETLGTTKVVEGGLYDTYQVVLNTVPTSNVVVTVTPNSQVDVGAGADEPIQLIFTPSNAQTPQTVVVRGANDVVDEGDHSGLITHSAASADGVYNGLTINNVSVSIVDNDAPKIVINEIDSNQASTDAGDFIELYDGGVGNVSLGSYVVVLFNGAATNNPSYASYSLAGKTTNAQGFFVLGHSAIISGMQAANSLLLSTLQNGADAVALYFGVVGTVLNGTAPTAAQLSGKLRDAIVYNNSGTLDADLIADVNPGQPQVNENANGGSSGETNSLSRVPDGGTPLDTTKYVAQTPTPAAFNQNQPFGVLVLQSASSLNVTEGGATDSYQIALQSIPTANVHVTIDPDSQTNLGAGAGTAIELIFTPANALIPQTVNIIAANDPVVEGAHTSTIKHSLVSGDSRYNTFFVPNVVAVIVDNDPGGVLAGDYNSNGSVDAADYVLWRKTLGSITNLQADGSGPTIGVPNGIVDQPDYTYWRSFFGLTGAASGAGESLHAAESLATSSSTEPQLAPSLVSEQPIQASQVAAVDAAGVFLGSRTGSSLLTLPSRTTFSQTSSSAVNSSADLRLSIIRPVTELQSYDDTSITLNASSDDASSAIDDAFGSLDAARIFSASYPLSMLV